MLGSEARSPAERLADRAWRNRHKLPSHEASAERKLCEEAREADAEWKARERDPSTPHLALEQLTLAFRNGLARAHVATARAEKERYDGALGAWEEEIATGELRTLETERVWICAPCADCPEVRENSDYWETPVRGRSGRCVFCASTAFVGRYERRRETAEIMQEAASAAKWHEQRAEGQRNRFPRMRSCGTRTVHAKCMSCGTESKPVPELCGVRRVCPTCDVAGAMKRRARFGRARGRILTEANRYGLFVRNRPNGAFTEKMLTLTVPHVTVDACRVIERRHGDDVRTRARDDLDARILALRLAWPLFLRKWNAHWRERFERRHVAYHRAFEWTASFDMAGHPHFHTYVWSPWIDVRIVREYWAEALRAVGVPVPKDDDGRSKVIVDLRQLKKFDVNWARELIKGGKRQALELSQIVFEKGAAGLDAFSYADGWTIGDIEEFCSPDVQARLYMSLEGARLSQASSGFFVEDPPPECTVCGSANFGVWITSPAEIDVRIPAACSHERAPPWPS